MDHDPYNDEVGAALYDTAFGWPRTAEADFAEACVRAQGDRGAGALLDLACGSGRFLQEMQARGWHATGVDLNPRMLDQARAVLGEAARLEAACMSRFAAPGPFDLATCWFDSLTYLLTNDGIVRHLRRVAHALAPAGLYLVDLGFSVWADPIWHDPLPQWQPEFAEGWTIVGGAAEVYHDGCDGPPCDALAHTYTEYLHFRRTDVATGAVGEHTYRACKRALHPQEFAALVAASGVLEIAGWFTGDLDLRRAFTSGRERGLVVLRHVPRSETLTAYPPPPASRRAA